MTTTTTSTTTAMGCDHCWGRLREVHRRLAGGSWTSFRGRMGPETECSGIEGRSTRVSARRHLGQAKETPPGLRFGGEGRTGGGELQQ